RTDEETTDATRRWSHNWQSRWSHHPGKISSHWSHPPGRRHTGYLKADATINKLQRTMTGHITSDLDGDVQSVNDQDRIDEDRANM
ncbi:hypothetical protein, partial [Mycolicibacterium peregrinum]|uniref:hypothetical protein n=2 Tax=Mycolicibacterium peregrinum TaxID=43304 RepID=UPI0021F337A5